MSITVYTFLDEDEVESGFSTQDYSEAKEYAQEYGLLVVANEYEWSDSEHLEDYRPKETIHPAGWDHV